MAIKPTTPNIEFPPNLVQFPAVAATPEVTMATTQITQDATIGLDGADFSFTSASLDLAGQFSISGGANVGFPSLTTLSGSAAAIIFGSAVESVDFGSVASLDGTQLSIQSTSITSADFPDLASISNGADLLIQSNASLTEISLPVLVLLVDGFELLFNGNALPSANVNEILAIVLAIVTDQSLTSGTLALQGGTNGAPTGQGITDKSDLITAGITVTTN